MARRSNPHSLGNGLEEIQFFSKDIDYDKELYESNFLAQEESENDKSKYFNIGKPMKHVELVKKWEEGGPVKVLPLPDFEAYPLYFTNFQKFDYYELKDLLGNFFTLCEFEDLKVRVTYKTEEDLRVGYEALKKDQRYNMHLVLDTEDRYSKQRNNTKKDYNVNQSKNKMGSIRPRLINQWINNGDVVIETSKTNCYPIQIDNYKQLDFDELVELFSKYGKFTSIAQLENDCVQVKFCTEEAARKCIVDLKKDRHYNVRLLFFLKELNTNRKLVKEIASSKSDAHVLQLMNAEERIKFDPFQIPVKRQPSRANRKNKKQEEQKTENSEINTNVIYYDKTLGGKGNVYIKGTPLDNPFLSPPYSYIVWKNKQNHLPPPPPEDTNKIKSKDLNYEYYVKSMKALGNHSHSSCCNGNQ